MTFSKWRTVLFVNGCFWHQHPHCNRSMLPKSNKNFWRKKLERNAQRDRSNYDLLAKRGWRVLVVWECEIARSDFSNILKNWFRAAAGRKQNRARKHNSQTM
jgi:DNA mismatch endonuclease (patch repair protein)